MEAPLEYPSRRMEEEIFRFLAHPPKSTVEALGVKKKTTRSLNKTLPKTKSTQAFGLKGEGEGTATDLGPVRSQLRAIPQIFQDPRE